MSERMRHRFGGILVTGLLVGGLAGCGTEGDTPTGTDPAPPAATAQPAAAPSPEAQPSAAGGSKRLDGYTVRIFKFAYYLIPKGLSGEALLAEAAAIHKLEPDAQLVLVDDESRVRDYIAHAKAVSEGRTDVELPQAWADEHVIANLQKMMSGKWMLYKGYGYEELGEVR
jgi:hypothetical protein